MAAPEPGRGERFDVVTAGGGDGRQRAAARRPDQREQSRDWSTAGLLLVATGFALSGLRSVLAGFEWWIVTMVVATVMLLAAAIVRSFGRHRLLGLLAALATGVAVITLLFAPAEALLGVIPTPESIAVLRELEFAGAESIASQGIPADAEQGIVYLLCIGVGALVFSMDLFASGARMPVLTGLPLLVLLLVPSFVDPDLHDPLTFVLTAAAYLGILLVQSRPGMRRIAVAVGATGLVAALVAPVVLPPVEAQATGGGSSIATGLNPIIALGDDLRRGDPSIAYTYTSTVEGGQYFRLTTLDELEGVEWAPSTAGAVRQGIDDIGEVPGLAEGVPTAPVTTVVTIGDILSRWLPAPYAPRSVQGLDGDWRWEPEGLAIGSRSANAFEQQYTVRSLAIQPAIEQLLAAGRTVPADFDRYLQLPDDLPDIVGEIANDVGGAAATNYEAAVALQEYFRGGDFTYSEQAPVEQGYDGSGASVLDEFLDVKAGYCVHFSSAMTAMARVLGIPARVAVGFTPGTAVLVEGETVYRVTTHEFHAWPELYFDGIGWVRFEPTPGRGAVPAFAVATEDDPSTPDIDESAPPPAAATPAPVDTPQAPEGLDEEAAAQRDRGGGTPAAASGSNVSWIVLAVLLALGLTPAAVRVVRREQRMARVRGGSGAAAWAELRDTVHDLGSPTSVTLTPRQFADELRPRLGDEGRAAIARLATALEHQAYAPERPGLDDRHAVVRDPYHPQAADVRAVRRELTREAGSASRIAAVLAPRSLFAVFLPRVAAAE